MSLPQSPLEYLISRCESLRRLMENTDLSDHWRQVQEAQVDRKIRCMCTCIKAEEPNIRFSKKELEEYLNRLEEYRAYSFYIDDLLNFMERLLAEKTA